MMQAKSGDARDEREWERNIQQKPSFRDVTSSLFFFLPVNTFGARGIPADELCRPKPAS